MTLVAALVAFLLVFGAAHGAHVRLNQHVVSEPFRPLATKVEPLLCCSNCSQGVSLPFTAMFGAAYINFVTITSNGAVLLGAEQGLQGSVPRVAIAETELAPHLQVCCRASGSERDRETVIERL